MTPDIGDLAPNFRLMDSTGEMQSFHALLADRTRILIFYRGHW